MRLLRASWNLRDARAELATACANHGEVKR